MDEGTLLTAAIAIAAGVIAQIVATRLAIPGIVLLLAAGASLGPDGLGWIDPSVFGAATSDLVRLAVTVILFEGALGLDLHRLHEQRRALLLLVTVGGAIAMAVGTLAARALLDLPWSMALLYGALMIVTGPTVVTPIVSRLPLGRRVRELLVSEGVLIDPIGAIVALVAAEYVLGWSAAVESGYLVLQRLGTGAVLGVAVGLLLAWVLRRRAVPEHLENPLVLATVLATAAVASGLSEEAGLMAAVAQGTTLANSGVRDVGRLREFKEALSAVLLGFLFIVLTANVRLAAIADLGWRGLAVVAALMWIGRPIGVLVATAGSPLSAGERAFVAWICPRGIVAASVAGFFRLLLGERPGAAELEALTFLTVAVTVVWQGLTARTAAGLFGANRATPFGVVIVGADELGRLLARTFGALGGQAALVDQNPWFCAEARREGLAVYEGDALSIDGLEEAGVRHAGTVVTITRNRELNALVAQRVRDNFKVERVLALAPSPDGEEGAALFPGDFPGLDEANARLRAGKLGPDEEEVPSELVGSPLASLPDAPGAFTVAVIRRSTALVATGDVVLAAGDRLLRVRPRVEAPKDAPAPTAAATVQ